MPEPPPVELPPEIVVTESDNGDVRFQFPRREFGWARLIGFVFIAAAGGLLFWAVRNAVNDWRPQNQPLDVPDFIFLGLNLFLAAFAYFPLWLGLAVLAGRREVTLSGGKLRTTERVGPLWRTKRWPMAKLDSLQVVPFFPGDSPNPRKGSLLSQLDALSGVLADGKRFMVVPAYPRRLLNPFAEELARRCHCKFDRSEYVPLDVARKRLDDAALDIWNLGGRPQPQSSRAVVEDGPDGVTISLPPMGFGCGSVALLVVGTVLVAAAVAITVFAGKLMGMKVLLVDAAGTGGLLLALHGVRIARRRVVVAVVGRQLLILQTGLIRSKRQSWPADELTAARVGKSGMQVNEVDILELQIVPGTGPHVGLLAGRDTAEIAWIAATVRDRLGLES